MENGANNFETMVHGYWSYNQAAKQAARKGVPMR